MPVRIKDRFKVPIPLLIVTPERHSREHSTRQARGNENERCFIGSRFQHLHRTFSSIVEDPAEKDSNTTTGTQASSGGKNSWNLVQCAHSGLVQKTARELIPIHLLNVNRLSS